MSVGLDIGTTKIVLTMGYLCDDGKVDLCGYGKAPSTGVQYGLILNLQDTIDGITAAKQQIEDATGVPVSDVYVGHIGHAVGRGAVISVIMVLTVLPQMILLFDKAIEKTTLHIKRKTKEPQETE